MHCKLIELKLYVDGNKVPLVLVQLKDVYDEEEPRQIF